MIHWKDLLDLLTNFAAVVGIPGLIGKFIWDGRKKKATDRTVTANADVDEATAKDKIESSSISTMEARVALLIKSHDSETKSLRATIDHQVGVITETLAEMATLKADRVRLMAMVATLEERVGELQASLIQVTEDFTAQLVEVGAQLRSLHDIDTEPPA